MQNKPISVTVGVVVAVLVGLGAGAYYAKTAGPKKLPVLPNPSVVVGEPNPSTPWEEIAKGGPATGGYALFLVAFGDNGGSGKLIGCGDSLVAVGTQATTPKAALEALLAIKTQSYGQSGLNTALYSSALTVDSVGPTRIDLSGTTSLGGSCDVPRFQEQLEATAHQFPGYEKAVLYVNGKTLKDALSLK